MVGFNDSACSKQNVKENRLGLTENYKHYNDVTCTYIYIAI